MKRKEYLIEFNKVLKGENLLEYKLGKEFLHLFAEDSTEDIDIQATVKVQKSENMYQVTLHLKGSVKLTCDLCLDEYPQPVDSNYHLIIKVSEQERYDDDEIIYITPETISYDLSQFIYDNLMLSIPLKKVCTESGKECNQEVVSKMDELRYHEEEEPDPRWEKLKEIKKNK